MNMQYHCFRNGIRENVSIIRVYIYLSTYITFYCDRSAYTKYFFQNMGALHIKKTKTFKILNARSLSSSWRRFNEKYRFTIPNRFFFLVLFFFFFCINKFILWKSTVIFYNMNWKIIYCSSPFTIFKTFLKLYLRFCQS